MHFKDFLDQAIANQGFANDDVVAAFLPLIEQLIQSHQEGRAAPLNGVDAIKVDMGKLWYEELASHEIRHNKRKLKQIDPLHDQAVEISAEFERELDVHMGVEKQQDRYIADIEIDGDRIKHPVYIPAYQCWEHKLDHHDPLSDIFSLGMMMASISFGLDFFQSQELKRFVDSRENLFDLKQGLHPVIAKLIVGMTELSRHRRLGDLEAIKLALANYRSQPVDMNYDLMQIDGFAEKQLQDKQDIILSKLQERLFDISRRNRLYHFKPSMQSVDLTQSSVPLAFNVESIRADSLMTWGPKLRQDIQREKPISLNKYLNFHELVYLPNVLDRIRLDSDKDKKEFGFAQLRLVLCFLNWTNLKSDDKQNLNTPLVLLPVKLSKKRGVRDTYHITPHGSEAEINPVIRYQFNTLYNIKLPETIDLNVADLDDLFNSLQQQIAASEPGVKLEKVAKPKIDLIYDSAKRRLDQYKKRVKLSGRGIRRFMDMEYSYDPSNYNPLGVRIFNEYIRKPDAHLKHIVAGAAPQKHYMAAPEQSTAVSGASEQTVKRSFYQLKEADNANPFHWQFDLCKVTLANFKYRKMSLVRDYDSLLESDVDKSLSDPISNQAFEASFSLSPKSINDDGAETRPLAQRSHVIACDPTQAEAIDYAQSGKSYIIQGPPGTGKSQTITNLIADYAMAGKRVLFVCEKRAAIDVVYLRLKQQGLDRLCSLIHDSQADKKAFVMDLKDHYEQSLEHQSEDDYQQQRSKLLADIQQQLEHLQAYEQGMTGIRELAGVNLHSLLQIIMSHEPIPGFAELEHKEAELEAFPHYGQWQQNQADIDRFVQLYGSQLQQLGLSAEDDNTFSFSQHPLRLLQAKLATCNTPHRDLADALSQAQAALQSLSASLSELETYGDMEAWQSLEQLEQLARYGRLLAPFAASQLLDILSERGRDWKDFTKYRRKLGSTQQALSQAQHGNQNWRKKLSSQDTQSAQQQLKGFKPLIKYLQPSWWKLKKVLEQSYDFAAHQISPSWDEVLANLSEEYLQQQALEDLHQQADDDLGYSAAFGADFSTLCAQYEQFKQQQESWSEAVIVLHNKLLDSEKQRSAVSALVKLAAAEQALQGSLQRIIQDYNSLSLQQLQQELENIQNHSDQLLTEFIFCLQIQAGLPEELIRCFRLQPYSAGQIKTLMACRSYHHYYDGERELKRFSGKQRERILAQLRSALKQWYQLNSQTIVQKNQQRLRENVTVCGLPAAQLQEAQKDFKKVYNKGRRELEHEFGKTMRYKAIRDLVAGDSGVVVKDLKPIWLMSPLSVSDTLPLDPQLFDVVIFDEASQITLEEAVPSIFRTSQIIVVGDEMQLPPTNFFASKGQDEEDVFVEDEDGEWVEYDLSSNSFLNHVAKNLHSRLLGWHYRSRSEHLISFSNWAFYQGRLLTVPDESLNYLARPALLVGEDRDIAGHAAQLLQRPVSFHHLEQGIYEKRCNQSEAEYIAELVRELLAQDEAPSIGIIAFSEAQQETIESALMALAAEDKDFDRRLAAEYEREKDGEFVGLLVKNLENIQGDERDVIILSVCYGYNSQGKMRMNFGPINQSGGEKRLNVAFSRAKQHMAVISSIESKDITNDYNEGANCLKNYLQYSRALCQGDMATVNRVLQELGNGRQRSQEQTVDRYKNVVSQQLKQAIEERGYLVDCHIGQSRFTCDLAVRREDSQKYSLGLLLDTQEHYCQADIIERELQKPDLLKAFGWPIHFVMSTDWYKNKDEVLQEILARLQDQP